MSKIFIQQTLFKNVNSKQSKHPITPEYNNQNGFNKLLDLFKNNIHVIQYLQSLTETEIIVLNIAFIDLGSSFDIEKSQGFQKWFNNHK
jgi:hypothetical protein